jgi:hypothetical protein
MPLWMLTPIPGGRVAIRIRNLDDRARRFALEDPDSEDVVEEWRCSRCSGWFLRETIKLVQSGRIVAGVPEIAAHCAPCANGRPRLQREP